MKFFELINEDLTPEQKEKYQKWDKLVNMSKSELKSFFDSDKGKEAGLSRKEADAEGIDSGRESASAIMRMMDKKVEDWNENDWKWAGKQISFISRMSGAKGPLRDDKGEPTRKLLALKIWGHDPEK